LTEAGIVRPSQALPPAAAENGKRSPARQGKKAVAFWVDPGISTQLRIMSATTGRSVQDLMTEALERLFQAHGIPTLAKDRAA
jgi:hypothetical protein